MSQTKQLVKSSFAGHLSSPMLNGGPGSSSSSSSTPSHIDEESIHNLNFSHFNLQHNMHLYNNQNWSTSQTNNKNSNQIDSSSSTSSSSSNWSNGITNEPTMLIDEFLKNTSVQSSPNEQRNNDLVDSNWNPFNSLQQTASEQQWPQTQNWQNEGDYSEWAKKSQQGPTTTIKSWAKIVSQQSSPSTNSQTGSTQTTNQQQHKNELNQQDWDIKVNQTVPWNLDSTNSQNQTNIIGVNNIVPSSNQTSTTTSSSTITAAAATTTTTSSSSTSSISSSSNDNKLMNNIMQLNNNNNKQDSGTEIWLTGSNNNNNNSNQQQHQHNKLWDTKENENNQQQQQQQQQNWSTNQQAPQWTATTINNINNNNNNNSNWNENSNWTDQSLVQQHQQLMAKIEPTGWEDPDFSQGKKFDDGTSIWGDPEQAKQIKVKKWSYYTKQHQPNPATIKPVDNNNQTSFDYSTNGNQQWKSSSNNSSSSSSWNNTPAAPSTLNQHNNNNNNHHHHQSSILNDVTNNNDLKINNNFINSNEWNTDLVDTKSWIKDSSSTINNKNEHEWDHGRVDTSNWGIQSNKTNFDPSSGVVDTSKWTSQTNPGNSTNPSISASQSSSSSLSSSSNTNKPNSQSNIPGLLNMPMNTNQGQVSSQDWNLNSNIYRDEDPRKLSRLNSHPSANNLLSQNRLNSNKMNLNFTQSTTTSTSTNQAPSLTPQLSMPSGSQTPNGLLNNSSLNGLSGLSSIGVSGGIGGGGGASGNQIQNQLIESFQLAVQANLISPDLLSNKLPPDVLSLLNQLFQTLNLYTNSLNRINNLNKRRTQLNSQQFKTEMDLLNQESQTLKDSLFALQKKINTAHLLLKQQQQSQFTNSNILPSQTPPGSANLINNLQNDLIINNSLASAAAAAGVQLSDLPILKDNPLQQQQNQSKLIQLIQQQQQQQQQSKSNNLNRQAQSIPNKLGSLGQNTFFPSSTSSQATTPIQTSSSSHQWSNFGTNSFMSDQQAQIDDRITPFVPGKPWAGQGQPSIEDDPNCTPGSFNKPLLTETIDPESILANLTRGGANNWSNSPLDFLGNQQQQQQHHLQQNNLIGQGLNNRYNSQQQQQQQQQQRNTSWTHNQQNFNSPLNNSLGSTVGSGSGGIGVGGISNGGTIGEQLWGVRTTPSRNGMSGISPSNNSNRNSANYNPILNQQQFYRSNSWNMGGSMVGSGAQFNNGMNFNGGYYLMIRNVTPQIDQGTLRALCSQHAIGQLTFFKYVPNKSCVIVRYNTKEETNIAHAKLNSITLGNTTINTHLLSENDLKSLFYQM